MGPAAAAPKAKCCKCKRDGCQCQFGCDLATDQRPHTPLQQPPTIGCWHSGPIPHNTTRCAFELQCSSSSSSSSTFASIAGPIWAVLVAGWFPNTTNGVRGVRVGVWVAFGRILNFALFNPNLKNQSQLAPHICFFRKVGPPGLEPTLSAPAGPGLTLLFNKGLILGLSDGSYDFIPPGTPGGIKEP